MTYACTGRCRHCSEGEHTSCGERIDPKIAADAVRKITAEYDIQTVMTFGGEPLLYPDAVYAIMTVATELNIPKRQVITNGYFSKNVDKIREVAEQLAVCGVNDLLLSVDAFHQETIPLDVVKQFAAEAKACGIPIRLSPAWLVSVADDNLYNRKKRERFSTALPHWRSPWERGISFSPKETRGNISRSISRTSFPKIRTWKIRATYVVCRSSRMATFSVKTFIGTILWKL